MICDPTTDFSTKDLSIDENLICWKFAELIKVLITLSSPADRQKEIVGAGAVADEMAIDFETYFSLSYKSYIDRNLLVDLQVEKLKQLDLFFDERSGSKSSDFWDDNQLESNPDWEKVRDIAKNILKSLKRDDLTIEFERKEEYERGRLIMQSTKSLLVKKK